MPTEKDNNADDHMNDPKHLYGAERFAQRLGEEADLTSAHLQPSLNDAASIEQDVEEAIETFDHLKSQVSPVALKRDLKSDILSQLNDQPDSNDNDLAPEDLSVKGAKRISMLVKIAAAIMLAFLLGIWFRADKTSPEASNMLLSVDKNDMKPNNPFASMDSSYNPLLNGSVWLSQNQAEDGSWHSETWGGHRSFNIGLTGLALKALHNVSSNNNEKSTKELEASIQKAEVFLLSQQGEDGFFGKGKNSLNQSMALLGLLAVYNDSKSQALSPAIKKGLTALASVQHGDGGWGFGNQSDGHATMWPLMALSHAKAKNFTEAKQALYHGYRWMSAVEAGNEGRGSLELRQTFLTSLELNHDLMYGAMAGAQDITDSLNHEKLATVSSTEQYLLSQIIMGDNHQSFHRDTVSSHLKASQFKSGALKGSWKPKSDYDRRGGHVFSTAMNLLTLSTIKG